MFRLAVCATHPIQYQVPIFRALAKEPGLELKVFFLSDHSVRGGVDPEFGVSVKWDVPLLEGYEYEFLAYNGLGLRGKGFFNYSSKDIKEELKKGRFDGLLVPGYATRYYVQAIRGAGREGIPVFLRGNNHDGTYARRAVWKQWAREKVLRALYNRVEGFFAIGKYMRRHYLEYGVGEEKIFDTPYCVDNEFFQRQRERFEPQREEIRRELGVRPDTLVLLYSGKLIPKKNPLLMLEAIRSLKDKNRIFLLVMGEGEMREEFENKAQAILKDTLGMVGFVNQSEMGKYYTAGDVLVLPSSWGETWGVVVNEAMNFGLPAVVSDAVGCREDLVQEEQTGYVFGRGDAKGLAERIERFLEEPELVAKMGQKAEELVRHYSVEENVREMVRAVRITTEKNINHGLHGLRGFNRQLSRCEAVSKK